MPRIYTLLVVCCLCSNCTNRSVSSTELSQILVVRQPQKATESQKVQKVLPITPKVEQKDTILPYHIIVASYAIVEKSKAERQVSQLKKQNHPASLLFSTQRYRVSIASFASEQECNAALPKYRSITKRNDIWIYKTTANKEEKKT